MVQLKTIDEPTVDELLSDPITGIPGCCAVAPRGHTAAPAKSVMKSRRLIARPRSERRIVAGQTGRLEVVKLALGNVRFGSKADIAAPRFMCVQVSICRVSSHRPLVGVISRAAMGSVRAAI